jgi:hypothetical protein
MSPLGKLLATVFIALFWNGIVSVFVAQVVKGWRSGSPDWFLTVFMIPFVLIGLGLACGTIYYLLALFNPRPRLTLTPGAVPLGGTVRIEWEITGRTDVLQNLRVRLIGSEEATYRRGTSTSTDRSVFANLELADISSRMEMSSGTVTATIPGHLMHTFASSNNKILWSIHIHGSIGMWPDLKEEFPVTVLPANRTQNQSS